MDGLDLHHRIALIGFMGVGKTTLGDELAKKLAYDFVDIDQKIEEKYHMPTNQIFTQYGEHFFRKSEKSIISHYIIKDNIILSLGGGAFLQKDIKDLCLNHCTVVYLEMSWEYWIKRLDILTDNRPLLQEKNINEIRQLFESRLPIYKDYHCKVNIDGLHVVDASEKILFSLKRDQN